MQRCIFFAALAAGVFVCESAQAGVTRGSLVAREGKRTVDLPLEHTNVDIRVVGRVAEVRVAQRFTNPYAHKIEAIYAFPLPAGAAVDRLELKTGDEIIRGTIKRRAEAKQIYQRARALGKIASLLEDEGTAIFTQSVANIAPGARVEVELHYVQELVPDDDRHELVFPMVVTPRPISSSPKAPRFLPPDVRSGHDISLTVSLETGLPIRNVESPSHRVEISDRRISIAADDSIPNKDFILRWELEGDEPSAAFSADRSGAFVLLVEPPRMEHAPPIAPRELVFALDTSSSMAGAPFEKAKKIIRRTLSGLGADDTFQIFAFSDAATALGTAPIAAKAANIERASLWLEQLVPAGGTDMTGGVSAALSAPHDPLRLRLVVFLTDGYVGDEDELVARAQASLGESRIFCFGVGSAVNRYLLEELAAIGRGAAVVLRADEDERRAVERFHARIAKPVLTDLAIDWGGLEPSELVPSRLPDLFAGQPLAIQGRFSKPGKATVTVSGQIAGARVTIPVSAELPAIDGAPSPLRAIWAKAKIRELLRRRDAALDETITGLALENGILTKFTAFVAVSEKITGGGPAKVVPIPVEVPEGLEVVQRMNYGYASGSAASASYSFALHGVADAAASMSSPTLDQGSIHVLLNKHLGAFKHCYELQLASNPQLSGRLELNFTVEPNGKVSSASISGSTIGSAQLETCILARVKTMFFPNYGGTAPIEIHQPYVFQKP